MKRITFFFIAVVTFISLGAQAQNNPPVANDDTDSLGSGDSKIVFVLNNDTDVDGNTLLVDTVLYNSTRADVMVLGSQVVQYQPFQDYYGIDTLYYVVCDDTIPQMCDTGMIVMEVSYVMFESFETLDINKIGARFNANGSDFWDHENFNAAFEVPIGSGKSTIFTADLWIGGKDAQDSLHQSATRYNSFGQDVYTGPIMDTAAYSFSQDSLWNRLWKINKSTIFTHKSDWQNPGYIAPEIILNWPGNGDTTLGQAFQLAPFVDRVGDGIYDPYDGDYPKIRGTQAIYFIRNDHRGPHAESEGKHMKIEIHGMAYAYDSLTNPELIHTIFVNYKIVNRSPHDYTDTYLGINFDPDIGDGMDDYIECDVRRNAIFAFNGPSVDGSGAPTHYGPFPPAQALVYLKGPLMDADGIDNASGSCDESLNGWGFGDSIVDNESLGMSHFLYYCNPGVPGCNGATQGDPSTPVDYYRYLTSKWKDGTAAVYGGNGHNNNCTSCEPSNFMFPFNSDSCNLGTGGTMAGDTLPWSDFNAGNTANDRRGIGSIGPFTFEAGDTIDFDVAYVYGRDTLDPDPYAGVKVILEGADSATAYFYRVVLPGDSVILPEDTTVTIGINHPIPSIALRPNPAMDFIIIEVGNIASPVQYSIRDIRGSLVQKGTTSTSGMLSTKNLPLGIYVVRVVGQNYSVQTKFVKL